MHEKMRSKLICSIAEEHHVSKQTIRNYLCLYLSYLDVTVLAPKKRKEDRELTQDEKNIRWALNKFFYTTKKQSLMTAYTMMLKEKYCDPMGVLAEEYPSFYQFRYFYRKTRKMQNFYIYRDGLKNYQRNNRQTAYVKRVLEEYLNVKGEMSERQTFHGQILSAVREEMQEQGMKLVGALLAGIGTVSVPAKRSETESAVTELPEVCGELPEELNGVLDLIA